MPLRPAVDVAKKTPPIVIDHGRVRRGRDDSWASSDKHAMQVQGKCIE